MDDQTRTYFYPDGMGRKDWFIEQVLPWLIFLGVVGLIFRFGQDALQLLVSIIFNLKGV